MSKALIPVERVQQAILFIRGEKVILDADLALIYGVSNQASQRTDKKKPKPFS